MKFISETIAAFVVLAIIVGALLYMLNPKWGTEVFKRIGVVLLALLFGVPLVTGIVREVIQSLQAFWFFLVLLAVVVAAYYIRESLARGTRKPPGRPWGAERTPVMPSSSDQQEESDEENSLGA
jgi:hypothetical protein